MFCKLVLDLFQNFLTGKNRVNKKLRNFIFVLTGLVMVGLCAVLGEGGISQVNKNEVLSADAASVTEETVVGDLSTEVPETDTYGDPLETPSDDAEDASVTDAEEPEETTEDEKLPEADKAVLDIIDGMTLEEKVAQLFIITPDALTDNTAVTMAGDATKQAIDETPVGGVIYMGDNLQTPTQVKEMLANTNTYSEERVGLPMFLCVDEEGGTVSRVAGCGRFSVENVGNMSEIGANGTVEDAQKVGVTIGTYLSEFGFNIDFAPVADVLTNPENSIVKYRSFGSDVDTVSRMSIAVAEGLESKGITATYKHFPGHGATAGDTHLGAAFTTKTIEELKEEELVPFQNAIDDGAKLIMVSHISAPNITGHDTPASLSEELVTELLREDMGFDGIVVTDAMEMGAISSKYKSDEAAVMAIQAGVDMILMPEDFDLAYSGVLKAAKSGEISEERLNESLARIIKVKLEMSETTN